jgi:cation:H+ antiporter
MVWIQFLITSAIVVWAAIKLAEYGDVIAMRTKLGGMFVGMIFLAGATSLPEMIASISSFRLGQPDLAAGNFFGSNMVNMAMLALVDLMTYQTPLLRRVAVGHALTAALATILMLTAVIFMLANISVMIGWVGIESILLILIYFGGIWLIQRENRGSAAEATAVAPELAASFPTLRRGILGFMLATGMLVLVVPLLVSSTAEIADITGLSGGFVGTALLSLVTSLPELLAALAAVRIGAFDMAVGNLFGSSAFNMFGVGLADFFYVNGRFLGDISADFVLVAVLGMLLTHMALIGNLARVERKFFFIEWDAIAIFVVYLLGMYLLYINGIGI